MRPFPTHLMVLTFALLGGCASRGPAAGSGEPQPSTPAPVSAPAPATDATRTAGTENGSAGSEQGGPPQTTDERRADIDRRLDGSLGTFDETLRKEQEAVAQERDSREAAATAAGSADATEADADADGGDDEPGSSRTENPPVGTTAGQGGAAPSRPGDLKSDKERSASEATGPTGSGNGASVGEIPDGSDDDIVARRLRKAAEQETDPELKEKLWKEYIEYKKNAGG